MMPYALRKPAPSLKPPEPPGSLGVMVLSKNGAGRIEHCLRSIVQSNFADEIVVFVDRETADGTAEIVRQFTPHLHPIETRGNIESVLPQMASLCSTDYVLRIDDDESLGGTGTAPGWKLSCASTISRT
jgi:Glycosyl transferase family 2